MTRISEVQLSEAVRFTYDRIAIFTNKQNDYLRQLIHAITNVEELN